MGTWGTKIYQNDISSEVKDDYKNKLKAGKSDEDALGIRRFKAKTTF